MGIQVLRPSFMAGAALAGVMAMTPVSEADAGDTSVTLDVGDTATVEAGGTRVETDADRNVRVYVNGDGSVFVYPAGRPPVAVRTEDNDETTAPHVGDTLEDGTIYAGHNFAATPEDAPGLYTWYEAKDYCDNLQASGHDNWTLSSEVQLDQLYQLKDTGAFAGSFNESADNKALYWSSREGELRYGSNSSFAWVQRFMDGGDMRYRRFWLRKASFEASVRCVRELEPDAP